MRKSLKQCLLSFMPVLQFSSEHAAVIGAIKPLIQALANQESNLGSLEHLIVRFSQQFHLPEVLIREALSTLLKQERSSDTIEQVLRELPAIYYESLDAFISAVPALLYERQEKQTALESKALEEQAHFFRSALNCKNTVSHFDYIILCPDKSTFRFPGGIQGYLDANWCPPPFVVDTIMQGGDFRVRFEAYCGSGGYQERMPISHATMAQIKRNTAREFYFRYCGQYSLAFLFGVTTPDGQTAVIEGSDGEFGIGDTCRLARFSEQIRWRDQDVTQDFLQALQQLFAAARTREYSNVSIRPYPVQLEPVKSRACFFNLYNSGYFYIPRKETISKLAATTGAHAAAVSYSPKEAMVHFDFGQEQQQAMEQFKAKLREHGEHSTHILQDWNSSNAFFVSRHAKLTVTDMEMLLGRQGTLVEPGTDLCHTKISFASLAERDIGIEALTKQGQEVVLPSNILVRGLCVYLRGHIDEMQLEAAYDAGTNKVAQAPAPALESKLEHLGDKTNDAMTQLPEMLTTIFNHSVRIVDKDDSVVFTLRPRSGDNLESIACTCYKHGLSLFEKYLKHHNISLSRSTVIVWKESILDCTFQKADLPLVIQKLTRCPDNYRILNIIHAYFLAASTLYEIIQQEQRRPLLHQQVETNEISSMQVYIFPTPEETAKVIVQRALNDALVLAVSEKNKSKTMCILGKGAEPHLALVQAVRTGRPIIVFSLMNACRKLPVMGTDVLEISDCPIATACTVGAGIEIMRNLLTKPHGHQVRHQYRGVLPAYEQALFALCDKKKGHHADDVDVAKLLIQKGANPQSITSSGNTLLHVVGNSRHMPLCHYFCELGLDVNAENNSKETPLHSAMFFVTTFMTVNPPVAKDYLPLITVFTEHPQFVMTDGASHQLLSFLTLIERQSCTDHDCFAQAITVAERLLTKHPTLMEESRASSLISSAKTHLSDLARSASPLAFT